MASFFVMALPAIGAVLSPDSAGAWANGDRHGTLAVWFRGANSARPVVSEESPSSGQCARGTGLLILDPDQVPRNFPWQRSSSRHEYYLEYSVNWCLVLRSECLIGLEARLADAGS